MSRRDYSVRVGPGSEAAIHPAVLVSLGVADGGCVDFSLVNGVWQLSGRRPVSSDDYLRPDIEQKLLNRQKHIDSGEYTEINDLSEYLAKRAAAAG